MRQQLFVASLVGGAAAGALDISYAMIVTVAAGGSVQKLLQFIASGLLGPAAFDGGPGTALLGLVLHFLMAGIIALIFIAACHLRAGRPLCEHPLLSGPLYGVAVCFVMRSIVVPLSLAPLPEGGLRLSFRELAAMMFLVGLPIAVAAARIRRSHF
jgi:hypothetical protein